MSKEIERRAKAALEAADRWHLEHPHVKAAGRVVHDLRTGACPRTMKLARAH